MYNITAPINTTVNKIVTDDCFAWCKEQYLINANNNNISGLGIIIIAAFALLIFIIYDRIEDKINFKNEHTKLQARKLIYGFPEFAVYLILGFFVWYLWFS